MNARLTQVGAATPLAAPGCVPSASVDVVALRGVSVDFGAVRALSVVDLPITAGESVALVGGNGSGKSTLLRVMHRLLRPRSGELAVPPRSDQAMLFQRPWMLRASVLSNVRVGLWLRGTPWRATSATAMGALERVELAHLAHRNARGLSGGQQQRVALARAWAQRPRLLLLDEPTASLDPHAKHEVETLMHEFASPASGMAHAPMTMVFASHNLGQVKRLARRVVYLDRGRVLADLPVEQFFDRTVLRAVSPEADAFLKGELL